MEPNLISRIARIIAPHLRTKHKDTVSLEIANQIIQELDKPKQNQ